MDGTVITQQAPPRCPKCGQPNAKLISSTPQYRAADVRRQNAYATMHVLQCECGMAFTFTEQNETQPAYVR